MTPSPSEGVSIEWLQVLRNASSRQLGKCRELACSTRGSLPTAAKESPFPSRCGGIGTVDVMVKARD